MYIFFQIGEWFYVAPGETIAIFSAEHDKFVKISYEKAAENDVRGLFGMTAKESADARKSISGLTIGGTSDADVGTAIAALQATPQNDSTISSAVQALDGKTATAVDKAELKKLFVSGNPILIFRPFQTWTVSCTNTFDFVAHVHTLTLPIHSYATLHQMASCILLKAGSELGNTFRK